MNYNINNTISCGQNLFCFSLINLHVIMNLPPSLKMKNEII